MTNSFAPESTVFYLSSMQKTKQKFSNTSHYANMLALFLLFALKGELFAIGPSQPSSPWQETYAGLRVDVESTHACPSLTFPERDFSFDDFSFVPFPRRNLIAQHVLTRTLFFQPPLVNPSISHHLCLLTIRNKKSISHKTSFADPAATMLRVNF
jgi:hypothetical protein